MTNYFVIGGDGKEYGPVSDADLRQWIAEGRLNAESRAKAESDAEFRPLELFPEFAEAFHPKTGPSGYVPGTISPSKAVTTPDFAERDYELDIGGCITGGWRIFKEHFAPIFAGFLLFLIIQLACAVVLNVFSLVFENALLHGPAGFSILYKYVLSAVMSLVVGPLMGGLYMIFIKPIRGQEPSVADLFSGFQRAFTQLFLGTLVVTLIINLCMLPYDLIWHTKTAPLLQQFTQIHNDPEAIRKLMPQFGLAFGSALPVLLLCLIPTVFLSICWQFTLPLIIDKQMEFPQAMRTSFKLVRKHWWQVFGLAVVVGLVGMSGLIACCIGIIFTVPIAFGATMYAYETIFGEQKN